MTSNDVNTLYEYQCPFTGVCDHCADERALFYQTEAGERLCNNCKTPILDELRDRGLGFEAIDVIENDPDCQSSETITDESESGDAHITEHLHEITPKQGLREDQYELEYDRVNWDTVSRSETVGEDDIITSGRYSHFEIDATGFDAMRIYLDIDAQENAAYLTDEAVYVYNHIVSNSSGSGFGVCERELERAAATALCELSLKGKIEGLKPADQRPPPRETLLEQVELSDQIESITITSEQESDEEYVVYAVPATLDVTEAQLLDELRTSYGITYSQPDRVVIVEHEEEIPDTRRE
ncbi:hypothetical protein ACLI4U_01970 [Natrialbaceae archaeon A-CW2]